MMDLPLKFMERVDALIQSNISNEAFGVQDLYEHLTISYSNLYRKVKEQTDYTPSVYIRLQRLKFSKQLLKETELNITEISFRCGFNNLPYFSKCFADYYGYPPSFVRKKSE